VVSSLLDVRLPQVPGSAATRPGCSAAANAAAGSATRHLRHAGSALVSAGGSTMGSALTPVACGAAGGSPAAAAARRWARLLRSRGSAAGAAAYRG